ncbi:CorA metal ion transporter [Apophysomyces sp. BC1034]|nr:CorA metal ion transporter [Apophysomyces sp. BC1034]
MDMYSQSIHPLNEKPHNDSATVLIDNGRQSSGTIRRSESIRELLETKPEDLDRLFDRPTAAEQDICFPSSGQRRSTVAPAIAAQRDRQRQAYLDLSALMLFPPQEHNQKQQEIRKKLSLYGDNQVIPIHDCFERYRYYHPDTGRQRQRSLLDLHYQDLCLEDLLAKENYWIDITSPSTVEMKAISKLFRIHPLTTEDIMSQEIREKCDVFRNYLFVCYRAFVHDEEHQLKPMTFYNIVFKRCILTLHFGHVPHIDHVQQRVEQLQDYIVVVPDWINYAMMDEITDSFAPIIQQIELEVNTIDDLVLLPSKPDQSDMVSRIGSCRKRVMQTLRLLSSKADVIRALIKRFDERVREERLMDHHGGTSWSTRSNPSMGSPAIKPWAEPTAQQQPLPSPCMGHKRQNGSVTFSMSPLFLDDENHEENDGRIFPDVALYLGDVQEKA